MMRQDLVWIVIVAAIIFEAVKRVMRVWGVDGF